MTSRVLFAACVLFATLGMSVRADTVYVRGLEKPVVGNVKSEDAITVVVASVDLKNKGDQKVPSVDIIDIVYDTVAPAALTLKGGAYRSGKDAEKDADTDDPSKRKKSLEAAVVFYNETLKKMTRDTAAQKYVARHLEYKVAVLGLRVADKQVLTDLAVKKLQDFSDNYPSSWQINIVMPLIAQVQMDSKDFKEAAKTYQKMAGMDVFSDEVRLGAELKVVEVSVRAGDIAEANKKLDTLEKKAGKDATFGSRVRLARADVLVGQNLFDKAIPVLQEVVKTSNDKHIKGLAHNSLGECLYKATKYNEALWEFLWVDAVFNQDKSQHAKALYYLWKTFEQLNNAERAQECRETLIGGREFNGTEYQRRALSEVK
jgi:tetratricopeptide (TPR) repeat protein